MTNLNVYCEYMQNPIGLDMQNPRFSWCYLNDSSEKNQKAYRILVSDEKEQLDKGMGNLWDSGMKESRESANVCYDGKNLPSAKTLYFKVLRWTDDRK